MSLHIYPVTIKSVSPNIHCLLSRPTPEIRSRPTIIYFHGLNGTRNQIFQDRYVEFAEAIQAIECNMFSVELRCHGERREKKERPATEHLLKVITSPEHNPFEGAMVDIKAIVDFLIEKRIAKPGKIAAVGLSWGGMHVLYSLKVERRITCGVALLPVCKITSLIEFRGLEGDAIIQKYEPLQFIDTLAPKPLLILTAEKGARSDPTYACQLFEKLRQEYVEKNIEDHLAYSMILGAGHAYHPLMSKMVVDWMQKFLLVEDDGPQLF